MAKRITKLAVEVEWDDEKQDHPIHWGSFDITRIRDGERVRLLNILSYEDFDEHRNQIGAG